MINSSSSNTHIGLGGVSSRNAPGGLHAEGSDFGLVVERKDISISSGTYISQVDLDTDYNINKNGNNGEAYITNDADQNASENMTVNSYIMFLGSLNKLNNNGSIDGYDRRTSTYSGEVVFDGEIVGIFFDQNKTRGQSVGGITYHDTSSFMIWMEIIQQKLTHMIPIQEEF